MNKKTTSLLVVALLLLMPIHVLKTGLIGMSKEELIKLCENIVWARVGEQHGIIIKGHGIYTLVTLHVIEKFKGSPMDQELLLAVPGGEVGDIGVSCEDSPRLVTGTEVLVFSSYHQTIGYNTTSMQGVHRIENGKIPDYDMTIREFRRLVTRIKRGLSR